MGVRDNGKENGNYYLGFRVQDLGFESRVFLWCGNWGLAEDKRHGFRV